MLKYLCTFKELCMFKNLYAFTDLCMLQTCLKTDVCSKAYMYLNTVVCLKNSVRLNSELLRTDIIAFWANPEMLRLPLEIWYGVDIDQSIHLQDAYKPVAFPPLKDPFFMGNKIMDLFMPSVYWAYAASTYTSTDKSVLCGWHGQYPINHFHFQGSFFPGTQVGWVNQESQINFLCSILPCCILKPASGLIILWAGQLNFLLKPQLISKWNRKPNEAFQSKGVSTHKTIC